VRTQANRLSPLSSLLLPLNAEVRPINPVMQMKVINSSVFHAYNSQPPLVSPAIQLTQGWMGVHGGSANVSVRFSGKAPAMTDWSIPPSKQKHSTKHFSSS